MLHWRARSAAVPRTLPTVFGTAWLNTVIYKQGGKMYMYDYQDEANTEAAENFQSQFDNDY